MNDVAIMLFLYFFVGIGSFGRMAFLLQVETLGITRGYATSE